MFLPQTGRNRPLSPAPLSPAPLSPAPRIAGHRGLLPRIAGAFACLAALLAAPAASAQPIQGAGSTFAAPVIAQWAKRYQAARADGGDFASPDWTVDYEAVGSLGGVMRLGQPELDFAATDAPLPPEALARAGQRQFPIVLGAVAIAVNLDGVAPGALKLSGPVLAEIYLGRIQSWADPAIRALNPGLALPEQRIEIIHRRDGSGTTFTLTQYLSAVSAEWQAKYGADQLVAWPLGRAVPGSQAVARAVATTKGAIGYLEFGQARRAGLASAAILNGAGRFVAPEAAGVIAAAEAAGWPADRDFFTDMTNRPGEAAYPIAAATFAVVPVAGRGRGRVGRVTDLFDLAFESGAGDAERLGYVPLPPALVRDVRAYWARHLGARG